jgi:8-amino-7-oxononanoate synthase
MSGRPVFPADTRIQAALEKRKSSGLFRSLKPENNLIDFCSNDYLGFARSSSIREKIALHHKQDTSNGSTGSRLIRGNTVLAENLETRIADFHKAESGLIFNSGYAANTGLFSAIAGRGDTILYDSLIHASIRDGIRLSGANAHRFSHNDLADLESKLKQSKGNLFVAVESVYSMDGDEAPLAPIAVLCSRYQANLIVDEAHATGVAGSRGEGHVADLALQDHVFARIHTFGKALGCHGAIVLGSKLLRDFLINFSRSFIYTTALPPASLHAIAASYDELESKPELRKELDEKIAAFRHAADQNGLSGLLPGRSPIQCLLIPGNGAVKAVSANLAREGFDVRPILSPTVPEGLERLRFCLHSFNEVPEIERLLMNLSKPVRN